jgi:hypothetical protein
LDEHLIYCIISNIHIKWHGGPVDMGKALSLTTSAQGSSSTSRHRVMRPYSLWFARLAAPATLWSHPCLPGLGGPISHVAPENRNHPISSPDRHLRGLGDGAARHMVTPRTTVSNYSLTGTMPLCGLYCKYCFSAASVDAKRQWREGIERTRSRYGSSRVKSEQNVRLVWFEVSSRLGSHFVFLRRCDRFKGSFV